MKIKTIRIDVPDGVAEGAGGEPAYIVLRRRAKSKVWRAFDQLARAAVQLNALSEEMQVIQSQLQSAGDGEREALLARLTALTEQAGPPSDAVEKWSDRVYRAYAWFVFDWNWLDIEGEPLPEPGDAAFGPDTFRDELDQEQIAFIRRQIEDLRSLRATEGNARRSTPS